MNDSWWTTPDKYHVWRCKGRYQPIVSFITMLAAIIAIALCLSQLSLVSGLERQASQAEVVPLLEDPKCQHGLYPGSTFNEWQFTVPANVFINKTGTFLHGEWYVRCFYPSLGGKQSRPCSLLTPRHRLAQSTRRTARTTSSARSAA